MKMILFPEWDHGGRQNKEGPQRSFSFMPHFTISINKIREQSKMRLAHIYRTLLCTRNSTLFPCIIFFKFCNSFMNWTLLLFPSQASHGEVSSPRETESDRAAEVYPDTYTLTRGLRPQRRQRTAPTGWRRILPGLHSRGTGPSAQERGYGEGPGRSNPGGPVMCHLQFPAARALPT